MLTYGILFVAHFFNEAINLLISDGKKDGDAPDGL